MTKAYTLAKEEVLKEIMQTKGIHTSAYRPLNPLST